MFFKVEFDTAIRGHHVYKTMRAPVLGEKLICRIDERDEAKEYDTFAISVVVITLHRKDNIMLL